MTKTSSVSSPYSAIKSIKCVFQHTLYGGFVVRPAFILHVIFFWFLHSGHRNAYLSVEDEVFCLFQFKFILVHGWVCMNTLFSLCCMTCVVHLWAGSK